eukprot:scaffold49800_cov22-Tisochrysis_lutea.AAC.3
MQKLAELIGCLVKDGCMQMYGHTGCSTGCAQKTGTVRDQGTVKQQLHPLTNLPASTVPASLVMGTTQDMHCTVTGADALDLRRQGYTSSSRSF